MYCPNCQNTKLESTPVEGGVEIDFCNSCGGIWLEQGEIFLLVENRKAASRDLESALKHCMPTELLSPRTQVPMGEITYPAAIRIHYCVDSGGLWIGHKEMEKILARYKRGSASKRKRNPVDPIESTTLPNFEMPNRVLLSLPNLFIRSSLTLITLYAILGVFVVWGVEFAGVDSDIAVIGGFMAVAAQFLISPFILDISLRWFYSMRWLKEDEIPEHLLKFIDRVCNQEKIKRPTIGLIEDGSPQAFTYGYSPSSARIVLSRGLMDLLTEKEVEAVVAHEIGHAVHWDILLMSMAQAVPLILYRFYRALSKIARESRKEVSAVTGASALLAYILYLISEYLVLWFSRTREYHADRFSGYATNDPGHLASALVKIGYGLAKHNPAHDEKIYEDRESGDAKSVGAMGIFDSGVSGSLAIVGYKKRMQGDDSDENDLKKVMRWDLWNPWARWYELNSTHPLIAHRLQYLSNQSITMNKSPLVSFDDKRPESYWDEFLLDFIIYALPICSLVSIPIIGEFALN